MLARSRARERRARERRGGKRLAKLFRHARFERRDVLAVLLVIISLVALLCYTPALDRFNDARPDQLQSLDRLIERR